MNMHFILEVGRSFGRMQYGPLNGWTTMKCSAEVTVDGNYCRNKNNNSRRGRGKEWALGRTAGNRAAQVDQYGLHNFAF